MIIEEPEYDGPPLPDPQDCIDAREESFFHNDDDRPRGYAGPCRKYVTPGSTTGLWLQRERRRLAKIEAQMGYSIDEYGNRRVL